MEIQKENFIRLQTEAGLIDFRRPEVCIMS